MRSGRRNRLWASAVFGLIAAVTVGGMAWATASSFQLARKNLLEERERLVSRSLGILDSHIGGILNSEAARDPSDYWRVHEAREQEVVAVYAPGGVELDVARVVLHSPLAISDPPHDWIDVYFQWAPTHTTDVLTSPQFAADEALWPLDHLRPESADVRERRRVWDWVEDVLPSINLHERVAKVRTDRVSRPPERKEASERTARLASASGKKDAESPLSHEYQQRMESFRDSQVRYLPPDACICANARQLGGEGCPPRDAAAGDKGANDDTAYRSDGYVPLTVDPITAFWMRGTPSEAEMSSDLGAKLAFVRECHLGSEIFYQGFVGDWSRLKPELLGLIGDFFDNADLTAAGQAGEVDAEQRETLMSTLPVRLEVPEIPGGATAAAWRRIRGTLITTWSVAAVVLLIAGMGLRSLVALTERRSQFAYAVTHELRTPLTTFRLYSDMLSAGLVPEDAKEEYLGTLERESQRLSSLVEDVLEYARLENHKANLDAVETDGTSLLQGIRDTLDKRCQEYGIEARTENGVSNGRTLLTDPVLVQRIAGVLVHNACRHARGPNGAAVLVRLSRDGAKLHMDVIDTGPGIDRRDVRNIFKPFRRGRRADATAQGGIGLGLALARSWASLLGGRLDLVARQHPVYGGAHFRLTIPVRVDV